MDQNGNRVDTVAVGLVVFRPFQKEGLHFVPIQKSDDPRLFSFAEDRWGLRKPLSTFSRLSNFMWSNEAVEEPEETFVFGRIEQGKPDVCHW